MCVESRYIFSDIKNQQPPAAEYEILITIFQIATVAHPLKTNHFSSILFSWGSRLSIIILKAKFFVLHFGTANLCGWPKCKRFCESTTNLIGLEIFDKQSVFDKKYVTTNGKTTRPSRTTTKSPTLLYPLEWRFRCTFLQELNIELVWMTNAVYVN